MTSPKENMQKIDAMSDVYQISFCAIIQYVGCQTVKHGHLEILLLLLENIK